MNPELCAMHRFFLPTIDLYSNGALVIQVDITQGPPNVVLKAPEIVIPEGVLPGSWNNSGTWSTSRTRETIRSRHSWMTPAKFCY